MTIVALLLLKHFHNFYGAYIVLSEHYHQKIIIMLSCVPSPPITPLNALMWIVYNSYSFKNAVGELFKHNHRNILTSSFHITVVSKSVPDAITIFLIIMNYTLNVMQLYLFDTKLYFNTAIYIIVITTNLHFKHLAQAKHSIGKKKEEQLVLPFLHSLIENGKVTDFSFVNLTWNCSMK